MKTKKTSTKTSSVMKSKGVFAITASIIAAGAASYYLFGPEGKNHHHALKGWMIKMKGEIVDRLEDVKELTEPIYHDIVDSVVATYAEHGKVDRADMEAYAKKLKSQWKEIISAKHLKKTAAKASKK